MRQLVPDPRVDALQAPTPPGWARVAVADLRATMSDHAHAEKKAALSALSLLSAEPARGDLVARMAKLAREELRHLDAVLGHLHRRGWSLLADRPDRYAGALLRLRRGGGERALVDRLLVAALIEARSWERLLLLGEALADGTGGEPEPEGARHARPGHPAEATTRQDRELAAFYRDLARSEAGHYRLFVELAERECPGEDVAARLAELAAAEADIVTALPHEARIH